MSSHPAGPPLRTIVALTVVSALLSFSATAFAGGDEDRRRRRVPGLRGLGATMRWARVRTCRTGPRTRRAAGWAARATPVRAPCSACGWSARACRAGKGLVRHYQRCLNSEPVAIARCYSRIDKRCVRPVFLGRCWLRDRFFRRQVRGYRCTERRLYEVKGLYEGRVICSQGRRRISHSYTLHNGKPVSVDTESELRAAWGNPRVTAIDVTADIFLRACEVGDPMRESARPVLLDGHGHTLRQTCFEKRLLRQDGTGLRRAQERDAHTRRQRRAGRGCGDARRDRRHRLQGPAEPCGGAGRRHHVPAPRHDHPLGHHRQPRQRRRRRGLRARGASRSTTRS